MGKLFHVKGHARKTKRGIIFVKEHTASTSLQLNRVQAHYYRSGRPLARARSKQLQQITEGYGRRSIGKGQVQVERGHFTSRSQYKKLLKGSPQARLQRIIDIRHRRTAAKRILGG